ncbi:nucleotide exchange factor GrpE [Patiriisocius hiemis]|uniref:Protein GrpE n=1 Tax=Patiriisocius hiemis TaxID=3075604 RepID=A0ABU2YFW4_9FLAO|nr:nucleotide exchange factor GrpE [Constantimarinum sp. W242]MDT0556766.1 nucleotide exchange factor GrpE [Constantimarinum sp. W242]
MSKKNKNTDTVIEEEVKDTNISSEESKKDKKENKKESKKDPLEEAKAEVEKEKERYLRLFAEFENYKKRTTKERIELFKTAGQEVITALLPIMDDFDRALKELEKNKEDEHYKGMSLINSKLKETLRLKGLQLIETKQGDTFDAEIHEAITQIPSPSDDLKGKIIDVVEKGYSLGDKIIRYPKVVIGQ